MVDLIDIEEPPHPADARLMEDSRLDRHELAGTLRHILMLKAQKKAIEEELSELEGQLKTALEEDSDPLRDDLGNVAYLKPRSKPDEVDLITFADKPDAPRLLAEAAKQGVLTVRLTQLKGLAGKSDAADALLRMKMPGGETHTLQIESH